MTNSLTPLAAKFDLLLVSGFFDPTFSIFENKVEAYSGAPYCWLEAAVKNFFQFPFFERPFHSLRSLWAWRLIKLDLAQFTVSAEKSSGKNYSLRAAWLSFFRVLGQARFFCESPNRQFRLATNCLGYLPRRGQRRSYEESNAQENKQK